MLISCSRCSNAAKWLSRFDILHPGGMLPLSPSACYISQWAELESTPPSFSIVPQPAMGRCWCLKANTTGGGCSQQYLLPICRIFKFVDCIFFYFIHLNNFLGTFLPQKQVRHVETLKTANETIKYCSFMQVIHQNKIYISFCIGQTSNCISPFLHPSLHLPLSSTSSSCVLQWHKSDSANVVRQSHARPPRPLNTMQTSTKSPEHCRFRDTGIYFLWEVVWCNIWPMWRIIQHKSPNYKLTWIISAPNTFYLGFSLCKSYLTLCWPKH